MILWFYLRLIGVGQPKAYSLADNVKDRIIGLGRDAVLSISPSPTFGTLFIALLALLLASVLLRPRRLLAQNRLRFISLTLLVVSTFVLYLLVPDAVGDGLDVANRILLFSAFLLVLLAIMSGVFDAKFLTLCSLIAALVIIGFAAEYLHVAREIAPALTELRSATKRIPDNSRILILGYQLTPSCKRWPLLERTRPERHFALGSTLERGLIVLNDYQGLTSHFPLKYSKGRPEASIDEPPTPQQATAWLDVLHNDSDVDFVVSWGTPTGPRVCSTITSVDPAL